MQSTCYSCRILRKLEFSRQIFGKSLYQVSIKIRPLGVELYADRRTDTTKLIVFFFAILLSRLKDGIQIAGIEDSERNITVGQSKVLNNWEYYITELDDWANRRPENLEVETE